MSNAAFVTGSLIVLHRRLDLPCFPRAETGPAAIFHKGRFCYFDVAKLAQAMNQGLMHSDCVGIREGIRKSVVIASPSMPPNTNFVKVLLGQTPDWLDWRGGKLPKTNADVIFVWLASRVMPRKSLACATEWLLAETFRGGGTYAAVDIYRMGEKRTKEEAL